MIKRLIFDIDGTLIPWKKEYDIEINKALDRLNITYNEEEVNKISDAFQKYENAYLTFNKDNMSRFINEYTKKQYPKELVYEVIKGWESCVPEQIEPEIVDTLKYLEKKYDMVILTDWYVDSQKERLKKLGILQYFKQIYGAESTKRKPFKEAFMQAVGDNKPEECVMIGDDIERDIKGAIQAGLKAIYYCQVENGAKGKFLKINNISELKNIL